MESFRKSLIHDLNEAGFAEETADYYNTEHYSENLNIDVNSTLNDNNTSFSEKNFLNFRYLYKK